MFVPIWTGSFLFKEDSPNTRSRASFAVLGEKVYAVGGIKGSSHLRTVDVYDPATDRWSTSNNMLAKRFALGVAVLNGCIYAVGGFEGTTGLSSAEIFDPKNGLWRWIASMSTRRSSVGVGVVNGLLYAVGGYDRNTCEYLSSVERYNPGADTWCAVADMSARRCGAGIGVLNNILYAVGGYDGQMVYRSAEAYNPESNQWHSATDISATDISATDISPVYVVQYFSKYKSHLKDLYEDCLQRSNFLPFIDILLNRSKVANMDSGVDSRKITQSGDTNYFVKSETDTKVQMERMFKILCSQENDVVRARTITHLGRDLKFQSACGRVLNSSFEELCDRPLAGNDYLQLAQVFHTVLIHDVPQLTLRMKSPMRRFITLIDTFYDNHIRVVISADVPLDKLFNFSDKSSGLADDQRVLMDDLKISLGSKDAGANVFTGEEELFAFDRTISRLYEMQSKVYWEKWAKPH
ncbi:uncharacterized protein ACN2A1_002359 [Glossina fuscipes fuscipes]